MIITANGNEHTVQIEQNFTPTYDMPITRTKLFNGSFYFRDKGSAGDKMYCKFKINGLTDNINALADDLYLEDSTIFLECEDYEQIFGPAYNYTNGIVVIYDFKKYDIEDLKISVIEIEVRASDLKFSYTGSFIPDFITYPVKRVIDTAKNSYLSIEFVEFAGYLRDTITKVDGSNLPTKAEIATLEIDLKDSEASAMFGFVRDTRIDSFLFETNSHFEVFLNTTKCYVKILDFKFKPNGKNFWTYTFTLVRDKQWESQEFSIAGSTSGSGNLMYSLDNGDTFLDYNGIGQNFNAIAFGEVSFVASAANDRLLTSIDKYNFVDTLGSVALDSIHNIVYGNGRFIANQLTSGGYYSDDEGQSWTYVAEVNMLNNVYQSCYFDGYYYFASRSTVDNLWRVYRSLTGISSYTLVYTTDSTDSYATMACGPAGICLVSNLSIFKTTDGTTWAKTTTTQICDSASAFGDGKFVFIGNNYSLVSTDLTTFNLYSIGFTGPTNAHTGMTYDGSYFITDGLRGTDGQTWEVVDNSALTGTVKIASTNG